MLSFGSILNIRGFNPENGWGVFTTDKGTVTGCAPSAGIGKLLRASGNYFNHPTYGKQFKADEIDIENPSDKANLIKMFSNEKISSVGQVAAKKLVDFFGVDVMKCLNNRDDLKKAGMKPKQIAAILEYADSNEKNAELQDILGRAGIGPKTIQNIIAHSNIKEVKENPFKLLGKVKRLSFDDVDKIWHVLNGDNKADKRVKAGLREVMRRVNKVGDTGVDYITLIDRACELLGVDVGAIENSLDDFVEFPKESEVIYSQENYTRESTIAKRLHECLSLPKLKQGVSIDELTNEQYQACLNAMNAGVSIVTGGPGTGKTTIIKKLCELARNNNIDVFMLAPTGLASQRMRESVPDKNIHASTIHLFLSYEGVDAGSMIVIDETSMFSTELLAMLLSRFSKKFRIVFVGDVDQLPSIEHGQVLQDLIESNVFPVVRLTRSFRFADEIGKAAFDLLRGVKPDFSNDANSPVRFIECIDSEISNIVFGMVNDDVQVLSPIKKGEAGSKNLNKLIAEKIKPNILRKYDFGVGDYVINTKNNYELCVFNGECGFVTDMKGGVTVQYGGKYVVHPFDDLNLELAYALTVHKTQGQEYDRVIIALPYSSLIMLQRRLIYTAVTRAKQSVVIVGSREALDTVLKGQFDHSRITGLCEHLRIEQIR